MQALCVPSMGVTAMPMEGAKTEKSETLFENNAEDIRNE
jgi:hypothetical protein